MKNETVKNGTVEAAGVLWVWYAGPSIEAVEEEEQEFVKVDKNKEATAIKEKGVRTDKKDNAFTKFTIPQHLKFSGTAPLERQTREGSEACRELVNDSMARLIGKEYLGIKL
jgi:hypothetical protein